MRNEVCEWVHENGRRRRRREKTNSWYSDTDLRHLFRNKCEIRIHKWMARFMYCLFIFSFSIFALSPVSSLSFILFHFIIIIIIMRCIFCAIQKWSNETRYIFYWSVFKLFKYQCGNRMNKMKQNKKNEEEINQNNDERMRELNEKRIKKIIIRKRSDNASWTDGGGRGGGRRQEVAKKGSDRLNCQNQYKQHNSFETISIIFFSIRDAVFGTLVCLGIFVIVILYIKVYYCVHLCMCLRCS